MTDLQSKSRSTNGIHKRDELNSFSDTPRETSAGRMVFPANCQRQSTIGAAGKRGYRYAIILWNKNRSVFISVGRPRPRRRRDLANDSLCPAVIIIACTSRKWPIVLIDIDIRSIRFHDLPASFYFPRAEMRSIRYADKCGDTDPIGAQRLQRAISV